jgi:hypothetical protein
VKAAGPPPFQATGLKIETVQMHREDQARLPGILLYPDSTSTNEARIVEVSPASTGRGAKAAPNAANGLPAESAAPRDVLPVYRPATPSGEGVRALGLAGAFEPGSERVNPYSLLAAPAVAADTATSQWPFCRLERHMEAIGDPLEVKPLPVALETGSTQPEK